MKNNKSIFWLVFITSVGYFVDTADLIIASLIRAKSIKDLGLGMTDDQIKTIGISLESWQSLGVLLGGITFGILSDKIGRLKMLYFSIALYSISTLLNGFLTSKMPYTLELYKILRFTSGFGLAAEMGVAITMISEAMGNKRGYGSMIAVAFGILGCVAAASLVTFTNLSWQILFKIGGIFGLLLLLLRFNLKESITFEKQKITKVKKGDFFAILTNYDRFKRLFICICIGLPTYYVVGLPIKFAYNFGKAMHINNVSIPIAMMTFYIAMSIGDLICNSISQKIKSRRNMFYFYNTLCLFSILAFTYFPPSDAWEYHFVYCPLLGISVGYWALIVQVAAETFGTNLRATVTTSVPNIIRSTFIPIAALFVFLESKIGTLNSGALLGVFCCLIALISTYYLKETFGRDLNFEEK